MKHIFKIGLNVSLVFALLFAYTSSFAQALIDLTPHEPTAPAGFTLKWYTDKAGTTALADKTAVGAGIYYAFLEDATSCKRGPASLRVVENTCPASTVDLSTVAPTTGIPTGATISYHTAATPTAANEISGTAVSAASAGKYYIAYKTGNATDGFCYSKGSPVVVAIKTCVETKNDIAQTPEGTPVSGNLLTNDDNITSVTQVTIGGVTTAVPANGATSALSVAGVDKNGNPVANAGTIVVNSDGTYTFTPADGFTGTISDIEYTGTDTSGNTDTATLSIEVAPKAKLDSTANNAPIANDDTNEVEAGSSVTTNVLANDGDVDGDVLSVKPNSATGLNATGQPVVLTTTAQDVYAPDPNNAGQFVLAGQASIDASGNIVFTAAANYTGEVPFQYTAQDGNGGEDSATLIVTVTPRDAANDMVTNDDANIGKEGTASLSGNVLDNDYDPENAGAINVTAIQAYNASGALVTVPVGTATPIFDATGTAAGTLTLNANGTYTFVPEPSYVGTAPVQYTATDADGQTSSSTLNLTLVAKEKEYIAKNDIAQTPQDTPVSGDLLTNDENITKVTSIKVNGVDYPVSPTTGATVTIAGQGTLVVNEDGTYTFTPVAGFTGEFPTVTYTGTDAEGNNTDTADLTIEVLPAVSSNANNAPVANDDTNEVESGSSVTTNVLANDNDIDGNTVSLKPNSATGLNATGQPVVLTTTPQDVYAPDPNNAGQFILAGQASIDANGNVVFASAANYTGDVPFQYTAQDGNGGEDNATLTITVKPNDGLNDTVANDDVSLGEEGALQSGNVLTNDYDPEGNTQTVKEIKVLDASGNEVTVTAGTATDIYVKDATGAYVKAGNLTVNSDGTYSYTPEPNFVGTAPVKVVVQDDNATTPTTDISTLYLTTTKKAPEAKNDIAQATQDQPVSGNLLTNDEGIVKVTQVTVGGVNTPVPATGTVDVTVTGGTLTIASDGSFTFTPNAGYTGDVPTVTYTGEDADGNTDTADLTIKIAPTPSTTANNAPVANDDTNEVKAGTAVTSKVLANDNDSDGDALSIKPSSTTGLNATGQPVVISTNSTSPTTVYDANGVEAGTAYVNESTGEIVFNAAANYKGDVPFQYTAQDGKGGEDDAKLTITVKPSTEPNSVTANDDTSLGEQGVAQSGNVITNDNDPDTPNTPPTVKEIKVLDASGNEVTVIAGTATPVYAKDASGNYVKAGDLTVNSDGTYSYTPEPNFVGTAPVKVVVQDGETTPATDTSTLYLTTTKKAPDAKNDIAQVPQDTPVSGDLLTNDEGIVKVTQVTVGGVTTPVPATGTVDVTVTGGVLTIASDGSYTFTPNTGYTGDVPTVTYTGEDADGNTDTADLTIKIAPTPSTTANNAPVANDDTNEVKSGGTVTTKVLANDNDVDNHTLSIKPNSVTGLGSDGTTAVVISTNSASPTIVYDERGVEAGAAYVDESTGEVVFTAKASYTGKVPFNYTAQDGNGGESSAKLTVTVKSDDGQNDTIANDDTSLSKQGVEQSGNVLTNDYDAEGNTQTVKEIKVLDASGNEVTVAAGTTTDVYAKDATGAYVKAGSLTVNSDGTYNYTPEPTFVGTASVKVVVQDNNATALATDVSTLSLTTLKSCDSDPLDIALAPNCSGTDAKIAVTPTNGISRYSYSWSKDGGATTTGTATITSPATSFDIDIAEGADNAGMYSVTVTDARGCFVSKTQEMTATNCSPLPVELVEFIGRANGCEVNLTWKTASEENFSHYEVEWSADGHEYITIGQVNGRGEDVITEQIYSYHVRNAGDKNYYRLKMIDLDETYEYSDVVFVKTECVQNKEVTLFPNPVTTSHGQLSVKFFAPNEQAEIMIIDVLARQVKQFSIETIGATWNTAELNISDLPAGTYSLRIKGQERSQIFILTGE